MVRLVVANDAKNEIYTIAKMGIMGAKISSVLEMRDLVTSLWDRPRPHLIQYRQIS